MHLLVLIPGLLVFLYTLYRLIKDDYVFIRKGISLEQSFDLAFISLWISLISSRLFDLIFYPEEGNFFVMFFKLTENGFSLTGAVIGGIVSVIFIGKYKKAPIGRFSDFLSLALLFSIPFGVVANFLSSGVGTWLVSVISLFLYIFLIIFFVQVLYPRLMSRTIREGSTAIVFLCLFSLVSLLVSAFSSIQFNLIFFTPENITLFILLVLSLVLLYKQERFFMKKRRTLHI